MNTKAILSSAVVLLFILSSLTVSVPSSAADQTADDAGLPSSFDQRDLGIVTPPKYQYPWDTCWAFAGTGSAETAILTAMGKTYEETGLDLSERHVAYFANNYVDEPITYTQKGEGLHTRSSEPNAQLASGGWASNYVQLFSTGVCPVDESLYPYQGVKGETMSQFYQDHDRAAAVVKEQNKELEEDLPFYTDEEREKLFDSWIDKGFKFPEGVNAENFTFDDFVEADIDYQLHQYQEHDEYSIYDDWSIGIDGRNNTDGYSMVDGNKMKEPRKMDGLTWIGIDEEAMNAIKSELMLGHGLSISYSAKDGGYNDEYGTYYQTSTTANHAVQLIGWDDNISKDKFSYAVADLTFTPEGDGAWLCKNNWGSETYGYVVGGKTYYNDWGIKDEDGKHTGYFWLSYYDRSLRNVESVSFSDKLSNENGYSYYVYDYLSDKYNKHCEFDAIASMSNVFTADSDMKVSGISISTREYGSDVNVKIYVNTESGNPASGELVYETDINYAYAGIHVTYPEKTIEISKGQRFSVVCEERNSEGRYVIGLNSYSKDDFHIYGISVVNRGESFLNLGDGWNDLVDEMDKLEFYNPDHAMDNFSIKVFSEDYPAEDDHPEYVAIMIGVIAIGAVGLIVMRRR
ncbi:MAG: hypothetical protein IKN41_01920 [Candidatus Methanomethylophilaceae archaeon]|nr:hypothetical protein [Candidatus Methanomethylophilaceae archaeon]